MMMRLATATLVRLLASDCDCLCHRLLRQLRRHQSGARARGGAAIRHTAAPALRRSAPVESFSTAILHRRGLSSRERLARDGKTNQKGVPNLFPHARLVAALPGESSWWNVHPIGNPLALVTNRRGPTQTSLSRLKGGPRARQRKPERQQWLITSHQAV
jgi:hypothetical protein